MQNGKSAENKLVLTWSFFFRIPFKFIINLCQADIVLMRGSKYNILERKKRNCLSKSSRKISEREGYILQDLNVRISGKLPAL